MNKTIPALAIAAALSVSGCSNMSTTEQRTLSGAAVGAIGGYAIGALTGSPLTGLGIGAAAGTAGGYLYDQHEKAAN